MSYMEVPEASPARVPRGTCKLFGAIKAIGTIRKSAVLVHGPRGCVYHINYILGMRGDRPSEVYTTALDEHDVIFGSEDRLREAIDNQGTRDFLDLYLPEETERYIFRIMAVKEIISNREKYGIKLYEKELYRPVMISEVTIGVVREVPVLTLARYMDFSYKAFRDLNLHLRKYRLPKGTYSINVPYEKRDLFLKRVKGSAYVTLQ